MPELSDNLHELFETEARIQATPPRGVAELTSKARGARRRGQVRVATLVAGGALVVGAAATVGASALNPTPVPPGVGAAASPSLVSVTWHPATASAEATAGFTMPMCGDRWTSEAVPVDGVTPIGYGTYRAAEGQSEAVLDVATAFVGGSTPVQLLGMPLSYVAVKDGVVVATASAGSSLDLYTTGGASNSSIVLSARGTCPAVQEQDALFAGAGFDPATDELNDPEWAGMVLQLNDIDARYTTLEPGTYTVYVISPVVFGEQLALAQALSDSGTYGLSDLTFNIGMTPLASDPRIAPYCTTTDGSQSCTPPQDVLDAVLTRDIDSSAIVDQPSGVAISAPVTVTVP